MAYQEDPKLGRGVIALIVLLLMILIGNWDKFAQLF